MNRSRTMLLAAASILGCICFGMLVALGHLQQMQNTLLLCLGSSLISLPCGIALAYAGWVFQQSRARLIWLFWLTLLGALLTPMYVQVSAWDSLFGKLSWLVATQGQSLKPILDGWSATVFVHGVASIPWVAIAFMAKLSVSNPIGEEQALLDTSPLTVFFRVTYFKYMPTFGLALLWNLILASREIAATDIYQVKTLSEDVYLRFAAGEFDSWNIAETSSPWPAVVAQIGLIWMIVIGATQLFTANERLESLNQASGQQRTRTTSRQARIAVCSLALFVLTVVLVPLLSMLIRCATTIELVHDKPSPSITLEALFNVLARTPGEYASEYCWTALIGLGAALLVTLVSIVLCIVGRQRPIPNVVSYALATFCVSIPGPIIGLILFSISNATHMDWLRWLCDRTIFLPVIAISLVAFPWAFLMFRFCWDSVNQSELDATRLDAGIGQQIAQVFSWRTLRATSIVALIAFVIAIGDLSASFFVVPPGIDTLSRRTLGLLHAGVNNETAALAVWNYLLVMISVAGLIQLLRLHRTHLPS